MSTTKIVQTQWGPYFDRLNATLAGKRTGIKHIIQLREPLMLAKAG